MATTGVNVFDEFSAARPALRTPRSTDLRSCQKAAQKISSILDLDQLVDNIVNDVANSFGLLETAIYLHDEARWRNGDRAVSTAVPYTARVFD